MLSTKAEVVFKSLNGVMCVYKPLDVSVRYVKQTLGIKLSKALNKLEVRPSKNYLDVKKVNESEIEVNIQPSYGDNVLAIGPRYMSSDFTFYATPIGRDFSGVCVVGINKGAQAVNDLVKSNPVKVIQINAQFGEVTRSLYKDSKVVAKSSYEGIKRSTIDNVLASFEAAHQRKIYGELGISIQSQEAYELAVQGLLRPKRGGPPAIYSIKCTDYEPPDFSLEIMCLNENKDYLLQLVHDFGLQLRTVAHTTGFRLKRYGIFTTKDALVYKQWTLEHLIESTQKCEELLALSRKFNDSYTLKDIKELQVSG